MTFVTLTLNLVTLRSLGYVDLVYSYLTVIILRPVRARRAGLMRSRTNIISKSLSDGLKKKIPQSPFVNEVQNKDVICQCLHFSLNR